MANTLPQARVIVNPSAGSGRSFHQWTRILPLLRQSSLHFEYDVTDTKSGATELAKHAAEKGYRLIICIGGDGTVNEVVNGLYQAGCLGEVTVGMIATGTGSDYMRTVGVPLDAAEAVTHLINPRKLTVDVGVVEYKRKGHPVQHLFVNFAGGGLDAEIIQATRRFKANRMARYIAGMAAAFIYHKNRSATLELDGKTREIKLTTALVCNGKYGGKGMLVAPDADPSDGFFDVLVMDNLNQTDFIRLLPRIYRGTHLKHPKVFVERAREVTLTSNSSVPLEADGELLGEIPAHFYILPSALNIIV